MNEEEIIGLFYKRGAHGQAASVFQDDCADIPGNSIVTTDSMSEGTHFRLDWSSPEDLATKLFQVNLSDIVASGGQPDWSLLNLGIPPGLSDDFLVRFARTLRAESDASGCSIIGGDTYRAGSLQLTLTMGGRVIRRLKRAGGRPGDSLYLSGSVGLSLAGYRHLSGKTILPAITVHEPDRWGYDATTLDRLAVERHLRPRARAAWAATVAADERVHACMDLSDGILQDTPRLAAAGYISLEIHLDRLPLAASLQGILKAEEAAASGEELELLFLGEPGLTFDFPCREIGRALPAGEGEKTVSFLIQGKRVEPEGVGFLHFL